MLLHGLAPLGHDVTHLTMPAKVEALFVRPVPEPIGVGIGRRREHRIDARRHFKPRQRGRLGDALDELDLGGIECERLSIASMPAATLQGAGTFRWKVARLQARENDTIERH